MPEITQLEKRIHVRREGDMTTREQAEYYANGHQVNEISYETVDHGGA